MDGMLNLLNAAVYGHPTALAVCCFWMNNYGCLPDGSTDSNEQDTTFVTGPWMIFPPR